MSNTIKVEKLVDTEYEYTDEDWDKLCFIFNEGDYSDSLELFFDEKEKWEELLKYNKVLHDVLTEYCGSDEEQVSLKIHE